MRIEFSYTLHQRLVKEANHHKVSVATLINKLAQSYIKHLDSSKESKNDRNESGNDIYSQS